LHVTIAYAPLSRCERARYKNISLPRQKGELVEGLKNMKNKKLQIEKRKG
jgi:hypothetical protein